MAGQEKIRINKVLKEFNIGLGTLVEFLSKKGYEVEAHPSAQISGEEYELLKKEYAKDQRIKEESAKISIKIKEITKKETQKQEPEEEPFEDEVIIKTTTIDHPSTPEPAITEKKADPAPVKEDDDTRRPEPAPAPAAQEAAAPAAETPAPVKEEKTPEEPKAKPEPAVTDNGTGHVGPRILGKIDLNKKPSKPQPAPSPAKPTPAKETAKEVKAKDNAAEKHPERHEVEHIETKVEKLAGPVISGKIDLSAFEKKHTSGGDRNGHRKRERIKGQGEKVDITKVDSGSQKNRNKKGGDNKDRKNRKEKPKPVRVEIDEELLKEMAQATGGRYFRATDNTKLMEIYSEINEMEKSRITVDSFPVYKELYTGYALVALAALLLAVILDLFVIRRLP